jgi:MFS family permease
MLRWIDTIVPRRVLFQKDRTLLHLFIGRVVASTGFAISIPFLGLYLHGTRGVPMTAVGGVFFLGAVAGALGQIVGGEWCDRSGRRPVLIVSQILRSIAFLALGLAVYWNGPFWMFALFTSLSGFAGRMYEPPSAAVITDITEGEARAEGFGVLRIGGNLGWAVGPALGGFLAALSYSTLFYAAAIVVGVGGALVGIFVRETMPVRKRQAEDPEMMEAVTSTGIPEVGPTFRGFHMRLKEMFSELGDPVFLRYCLATFLLFTVMAQLISTLSVYAVEWRGLTRIQLGVLFALNGLVVVLFQFPAVRATAKGRMTTVVMIGCALYGVGYGMLGLGGGMALACVAMFVVSMGEIVAIPASMSLASNFSTEATRGRIMGIYGLFNSFGWSVGPLLGGILLDLARRNALAVWGTIAALAGIAILGYGDVRRRIDPAMDRNLEGEPARAQVA